MNLTRRLILFLLCASLLTAYPAVAAPPQIGVIAVTVAKPQQGSIDFAGTQLKLSITNVGSIMKIDPTTTKLLSFVDDRGTDLLASGITWRQQQNYFTTRAENRFDTENSSIDSGTTLYLPVAVTAPPAPGALKVTVKGTIGLFTYPPKEEKSMDSGVVKITELFSQPIPFGNSSITMTPYGNGEADGVLYHYANFVSDVALYKIVLLDGKNRELLTINNPNPNENLVIGSNLLPNIKGIQLQYGKPTKIAVPIEITTGIGL